MALLPQRQNVMKDVAMNMNVTCLKADVAKIELVGARTIWTRRLIVSALSYTMIGLMSLAALLWLGIFVAGLVRFIGASH
jgi:hypothetical protein